MAHAWSGCSQSLSIPAADQKDRRLWGREWLHHGKHIDAMTEKWLYHARKTRPVFQFSTPLPGTAQHFCVLGGGGGQNKMPKAFLALAAGASVLGGSRVMLPRKIFKINVSRTAENTSWYTSRHSEFFYQANKHQIWTKITKHQTQGKSNNYFLARWHGWQI